MFIYFGCIVGCSALLVLLNYAIASIYKPRGDDQKNYTFTINGRVASEFSEPPNRAMLSGFALQAGRCIGEFSPSDWKFCLPTKDGKSNCVSGFCSYTSCEASFLAMNGLLNREETAENAAAICKLK